MQIGSSFGVNDHIQSWLASWGFVGNPFAIWEAGQEPWLERYFVRRPFYEHLLSSRTSALVFAARGGGKSALRIMLQSECRPRLATGAIFAISLTDFSPMVETLGQKRSFTLNDYLPSIFDTAITNLLEAASELILSGVTISQGDLSEWRYWIESYAPHYGSPRYLLDLLTQHVPNATRTQLQDWTTAAVKGQSPELTRRINALIELWQLLSQVRPVPPSVRLNSPHLVIKAFVRFIIELLSSGYPLCKGVYLLVDGIDEYALTQNNPEISATVLQPLLDLHFLETPHLTVKFFLPIEQRSFLEASARRDRLEIHTLFWNEALSDEQANDMQKLLRRRIQIFSDGVMQGLDELCAPDLRHWIENALLKESGHSPRNLLRLGNLLFIEHCRERPQPESELTHQEWERAVRRFRAITDENKPELADIVSLSPEEKPDSVIPLLHVDITTGRVFIGGQEIDLPLTELEFRLLACLYQNKGKICSRDDIAQEVYPNEAVSDEVIGSLIYRLRKKIERSTEVEYIQTIPRRGFLLKHVIQM